MASLPKEAWFSLLIYLMFLEIDIHRMNLSESFWIHSSEWLSLHVSQVEDQESAFWWRTLTLAQVFCVAEFPERLAGADRR